MINIFGTDGVRGEANSGYITPENAVKLAICAVNYYVNNDHKTVNSKFTVVIGKDTRLSGYMLEAALTAGFIAAGADVILLGPIPTPAVAFITRSLRADLGCVISASHNPYQDNGIKFFKSNGFKISPDDEVKISELFFNDQKLATPHNMGKAIRLKDAPGRYVEFIKSSFPRNSGLFGMKIVVDTANGAAYKVAPQVLWERGAEIIEIGHNPDGLNINQGCGATDTLLLQKIVLETKADIGIALDGDADRIIIVDEKGDVLDGDYVLAAIATSWKNSGRLLGKKVVATKMSNTGLAEYLESIGLELVRCDIGDKYVIEKMLEIQSNLGGEKSGHIIPIDYASTGDGMIAALQVLLYLQKTGIKASSIKNLYKNYPQVFKNVKTDETLSTDKIKELTESIEKDILKNEGRLLIRKSGTENIMRIMLESKNTQDIEEALLRLKSVFTSL